MCGADLSDLEENDHRPEDKNHHPDGKDPGKKNKSSPSEKVPLEHEVMAEPKD